MGTDHEGSDTVQSENTPSSVCCECPGKCTGRGVEEGGERKPISTEKGQGGVTGGVSPPCDMNDVAVEDLGSVQEEEGVGDDDKPTARPAESSEEGKQINKLDVDQLEGISLSEEESENTSVHISAVENKSVVELSCCVCASTENIRVCGGCKATMYCSRKCQISHRDYHAPWCAAITSLEKLELDKIYGKKKVQQNMGDEKLRRKIMKLVGNKPMLDCLLGGQEFQMLWDTGSMISLVDRWWVRKHFPNETIYPASNFVDQELNVQAANATTIDFDGVILLDFSLAMMKDLLCQS